MRFALIKIGTFTFPPIQYDVNIKRDNSSNTYFLFFFRQIPGRDENGWTYQLRHRRSDLAYYVLDWHTTRTSGKGCRISCNKMSRSVSQSEELNCLVRLQIVLLGQSGSRKKSILVKILVNIIEFVPRNIARSKRTRARTKEKEPLTTTRYYARTIRVLRASCKSS